MAEVPEVHSIIIINIVIGISVAITSGTQEMWNHGSEERIYTHIYALLSLVLATLCIDNNNYYSQSDCINFMLMHCP